MEMEGAGGKQSIIRTFEDLDVWKVCRDLRTQIATMARTFPKEEQYRLRDQFIRASRSVTANLAEGVRAISLRGKHPVCEAGKRVFIRSHRSFDCSSRGKTHFG